MPALRAAAVVTERLRGAMVAHELTGSQSGLPQTGTTKENAEL
ncbi:hypothetical protein ACVWWN_001512 [Mycobacterium sp. URHB0021]